MVVQQQTDLSRALTCHRTQSRKINKAPLPEAADGSRGVSRQLRHMNESALQHRHNPHSELLTRLWPALEVIHFNLAWSPKEKGNSFN